MTFPYSPAIPNPPNDPADDVKTMQTNAGSINSIIAVDHVGFNVAGGGQHNQVTFNSNNPPTPPVSPPILFTNNVDGAGNSLPGSLAELFFYSGSTPQSKDQYNVTTANGSVMLPMGIIVKWGTYSIAGVSNSQAVTFTNAFPNALFGVNISCITSGSIGDLEINYTPNSPSGFTGRRQGNAPTGPTYFFIAIGN
jgi:hypothetical protein